MPIKLRVNLAGPSPESPYQHAKGLHALALSWIQQADSAAAEYLHSANTAKPYTISPLWSNHDGHYFEISVLMQELEQLIRAGAESHGEKIRLGQQQFHRQGKIEIHEKLGWSELLQTSPRNGDMGIHLLTPTAHHQPGEFRKVIPLPTPENYFGSWLNKWNLYAPAAIDPAFLDLVKNHIAIKACKGHTESVILDTGRSFIGFVGIVTFHILKRRQLSAHNIAVLTALARFAEFAGTGVETLRGMGQTRLMGNA
jgi:CRISPR-associated endoribonuclease Cas6